MASVSLSSSLLGEEYASSSSSSPNSPKAGGFFSFKKKHISFKLSSKITEAAASLSAGLHHRSFHRHKKHHSRVALHSRRFDELSISGERTEYCVCCCTRPCVERLMHKGWWRGLYMFIITVNLLLALVEPSSLRTKGLAGNLPGEQNAILMVEISFLVFYGLDVWLRWYAGEDVCRDVWLRCRVFAIICISLNLVACLISNSINSSEGLTNFSRLLRPLLFIERLRNVRKIASSILSTLPKVVHILLLLTFLVGFFGVAGFTLFAGVVGPTTVPTDNSSTSALTTIGCDFLSGGIAYVRHMPERLIEKNASFYACSTFHKKMPNGDPCVNYFDTIWTSMMHLFILLTTANYPDIMMPVYDCSQWSSIFFIIFVTVGLYFLLSLILAVVYTHFAARNHMVSERMLQNKNHSLAHAFRLMVELTISKNVGVGRREQSENRSRGGGSDGGSGSGNGSFGGDRSMKGSSDNNLFGENGSQKNSGSLILSDDENENENDVYHTGEGKVKNIDINNMTDKFPPSGSISCQIWIDVVREYHPQLPIEIIESLFGMHDRDTTGYMTWEQFCDAVEHTRLKIKINKKYKPKRRMSSGHSDEKEGLENHRGQGSAVTRAGEKVGNCRRRIRMMLRHRFYDNSMDGLICLNTVFMLVRLSPGLLSSTSSTIMGVLINVLLFIFVVEIFIKCYALSPSVFWNISHFNKIDVISVGGGVILNFILWFDPSNSEGDEDSGSLSDIFLLVRITRMLRVLRMNEAFRLISATVVEIAPALLRYIGVLAGLFYAFAVIGMECFAGLLSRECLSKEFESAQECEFRTYRLKHSSYGENNYWSNNFDTLPRALVTLFEQMVSYFFKDYVYFFVKLYFNPNVFSFTCCTQVVNNWVIVMEGCVAAVGNEWPRVYFIAFWICCVVITMNVLIAFLIDAYQANVASIAEKIKGWEKDRRRRLHSQSSMPSTLRASSLSMSSDALLGNGIRTMSKEERAWQVRLQMAAERLGYDISKYSIRKEKGVSDFYQQMFKDN